MTKEEKELLLIDLCGRLPYMVKARVYSYWNEKYIDDYIMGVNTDIMGFLCSTNTRSKIKIELIKPYLFPMSSMTEEQKEEYKQFLEDIDGYAYSIDCVPQIDWLNKNHFDYRGLISMGLAIDCTNLNIY